MKSFSEIRAAQVRACIAALISLFVGQSMAAEPSPPDPTARVTEGVQPAPTTPPPGPPKVSWPDNGIAQRRLEGGFNYNMFVENDNGTWRAWVQSDLSDTPARSRRKAKALEFFSGRQEYVKASVDDITMQQTFGFLDSKGQVHGPQNRNFMFNRGEGITSNSAEFSIEGSNCSVSLSGIQGGAYQAGYFRPTWTKIPIVLDKSYARENSPCRAGPYSSSINSTLDLNDGTVLVTMECWVFRLRKSDLSPVGEAPALRIVDGAAMKTAIDMAKGQRIEDARAYVDETLGLHFDEAYACKSASAR